jgi:hypothetical protein
MFFHDFNVSLLYFELTQKLGSCRIDNDHFILINIHLFKSKSIPLGILLHNSTRT